MRLCRKLEFNSRFSRNLGRIPPKIHLGNGITLLFYINAFTLDFGFLLRDKDPQNMVGAQNQALKLERNLNVVGKKEAHKCIWSPYYMEKVWWTQSYQNLRMIGWATWLNNLISFQVLCKLWEMKWLEWKEIIKDPTWLSLLSNLVGNNKEGIFY